VNFTELARTISKGEDNDQKGKERKNIFYVIIFKIKISSLKEIT
jgi:hypothetical protein